AERGRGAASVELSTARAGRARPTGVRPGPGAGRAVRASDRSGARTARATRNARIGNLLQDHWRQRPARGDAAGAHEGRTAALARGEIVRTSRLRANGAGQPEPLPHQYGEATARRSDLPCLPAQRSHVDCRGPALAARTRRSAGFDADQLVA